MSPKFFIFILLLFSTFAQAEMLVSYDASGFPVCATTENKTYFFNWDPWTRAEVKTVFYFDKESYIRNTGHYIEGCKDLQYIKEIPAEILIPISLDAGLFPDSIHFALGQVSQGGHKFHSEKMPLEDIATHSNQFEFNSPEVLTRLENEVGKTWAQQVISSWAAKSFGKNQNCQNFIGSCDFYLCQDKENPCGIEGYNLNFGYKYCSSSQFSLLKKMQTTAGQGWVRGVISCLQKKSFSISKFLDKNLPAGIRCEKIQTESFNSHPDCYVESGFCDLPLKEKMHIAGLIKNDIFTQNTFSEALSILKLCEDKL